MIELPLEKKQVALLGEKKKDAIKRAVKQDQAHCGNNQDGKRSVGPEHGSQICATSCWHLPLKPAAFDFQHHPVSGVRAPVEDGGFQAAEVIMLRDAKHVFSTCPQ